MSLNETSSAPPNLTCLVTLKRDDEMVVSRFWRGKQCPHCKDYIFGFELNNRPSAFKAAHVYMSDEELVLKKLSEDA